MTDIDLTEAVEDAAVDEFGRGLRGVRELFNARSPSDDEVRAAWNAVPEDVKLRYRERVLPAVHAAAPAIALASVPLPTREAVDTIEEGFKHEQVPPDGAVRGAIVETLMYLHRLHRKNRP